MWIKTNDSKFVDVRNGALEFVSAKEGGKLLQFLPFGGKAVTLCDSLTDVNARNLNHLIEEALANNSRLMELPLNE